jgi:hypothetical protein
MTGTVDDTDVVVGVDLEEVVVVVAGIGGREGREAAEEGKIL